MQVQDIAEFNSNYFNYMIAAQESEAGEGWDYDTWVDDLYTKKDTEIILKTICDGFVKSYTDEYSSAENDQTLSFLDLSKMAKYKTDFDSFTTKVKTVGLTKLRQVMKNVKNYGDSWCEEADYNSYITDYNYPSSWFYGPEEYDGENYYMLHGYYLYGTFDVVDMLNKLKANSNFSSCITDIYTLLTDLSSLIKYSVKGQIAGESNGLCVVVDMDGSNFVTDEYTAKETNFTAWRSFVTSSY